MPSLVRHDHAPEAHPTMRTPTRPKTARIATLAVAAALLFTLIPAGASAGAGQDRERWMMKRETNESRLQHDLSRLDLHDRLSDLARRHSLAMAREGSLFHTADPSSYYLGGIRWSAWGENVGVTGGSAEDLQRAFMRSPPHRANVLNRAFRNVAIGAVRVDGALWVTVFFYG